MSHTSLDKQDRYILLMANISESKINISQTPTPPFQCCDDQQSRKFRFLPVLTYAGCQS